MMRPIFVVHLMYAIFQYGEASEALTSQFVASFSCSGEPLCATDAPTQEFSARSLLSCGILCSTTSHCLQFNYVKTLSKCQLYDFVPSSSAAIENCIGYAPLVQSTVVAVVEQNATMKCQRPSASVRWMHLAIGSTTPKVITENCQVQDAYVAQYAINKTTDNCCDLVVINAQEKTHAGTYICQDQALNQMSATVELAVIMCPPDFVKLPGANSSYKFIAERRDWNTAASSCQTLFPGAYMAVITSKIEQLALSAYLNTAFPLVSCSIWISGQMRVLACDSEFQWKPTSGITIPVNYTNWDNGEPNCSGGGEFCIQMAKNEKGSWNDDTCSETFCFLCEYGPI